MRTMICVVLGMLVCVSLGACKQEDKSTPAQEVGKTVDQAAEDAKAASMAENKTEKDAQTLLQQVTAAIQSGELDKAEEDLKKLEAQAKDLPQKLQDQIEQARKSLDTAKSADQMKTDVQKQLPKL